MPKKTSTIYRLWPVWPVLAGVLALLVVDLPSPTRNIGLFINSLHAPAFAILSLFLLNALLKVTSLRRAMPATALACLLLGLVGEILQMWGPRDADLLDLANDAIGIAAGLCLAWVFVVKTSTSWRGLSLAVGLVLIPLLALTFAPAAWFGYAAVAQQRAMPKILTFDKRWETSLYEASFDARLDLQQAPDNWPIKASRLVKITATGTRYPGITIQPTSNWEDYETLRFLSASAINLPVSLTISIYDDDTNRDYTNRFNYSFVISNEPQLITIPLAKVKSAPSGRSMNMRAIKEIVIFISGATGSEAVFLDEFQLTP